MEAVANGCEGCNTKERQAEPACQVAISCIAKLKNLRSQTGRAAALTRRRRGTRKMLKNKPLDTTIVGKVASPIKLRSVSTPMFYDHQLIGDSLLVRFAEQILFDECSYENGILFLGLCVSGQTIQELRERVEQKFAPVAEKGILLIGMSDLIQGSEVERMISEMEELINLLQKLTKKLIVLTLPPMPKLTTHKRYWSRLTAFNTFLKTLHNGKSNFVGDITHFFLMSERQCKIEYYERFYDRRCRRPDMVHLSRQGLNVIRNFLTKNRLMERYLQRKLILILHKMYYLRTIVCKNFCKTADCIYRNPIYRVRFTNF